MGWLSAAPHRNVCSTRLLPCIACRQASVKIPSQVATSAAYVVLGDVGTAPKGQLGFVAIDADVAAGARALGQPASQRVCWRVWKGRAVYMAAVQWSA